ncbi:MAG: DNA mismatch repair endonuclease MutL [Firmicutes bacterium]|nr:DNA mismatch repair endonuclease MutL [Bacillota bacterium]
MGKIHLLDTEVSNKIAAGEVVERPASVIKELVENSIDAGANLITVEIEKGGSVYMRVSDNGSCMSAEDAKICFLRHATSKVRTSGDLDAIYTLGFRGEALSSIGAVSETELYTKRAEDEIGICVTCRGGEILSSDEAGIPNGTSVLVENLFYNTPARRKFLKKDATEAGYITDIMTRFIFAHPEISFKLITDGKEKLFSPGDNSLKNSVYTVYGKDYANGTIPVEYEADGIKVTGLIGKGTLSRPKRNYQSFFVNKRYITSAAITAALENAYKNQIMIGKFPMAVLNIEINPSCIDINVHPTKLEVKFSDERAVYNAVYYGVKNALYAIPNVPKIERTTEEFKRDEAKEQLNLSDMAAALPRNMTRRPETPDYNPRKNPFLKESGDTKTGGLRDTKSDNGFYQKPDFIKEKNTDNFTVPKTVSLASPKREIKPLIPDDDGDTKPETAEETVFADEYFEIVGQVFDSFIIAEKGGEMMIIDQHAAHERLKYEELKREIESKQAFSQMLIEPVIVSLNAGEMAAYRDNKRFFDNVGFESEEFGEDSVIIRAVPGEVEMGEVEPLMLELVSQGEALKKELITEKQQRLLYTIACKSAVKANMRMSKIEMETLVRNVLRLKNINTCPHGRPIIITMSKKEIEKEFKRIV